MSDLSPANGFASGRTVTVSDANSFIMSQALAVICTVAGNVSVKLVSGYTFTFPVATGLTIVPVSVIQVLSTGTTATATYTLLN